MGMDWSMFKLDKEIFWKGVKGYLVLFLIVLPWCALSAHIKIEEGINKYEMFIIGGAVFNYITAWYLIFGKEFFTLLNARRWN